MAKILLSVLALFIFGSVAAAQDAYKIRPGDVLRIEVLEDQSLNRDALVLPDGSVTVPLIGGVPAGGRSLESVRSSIVSGLAPNFASSPTVFVTISSLANVVPSAIPSTQIDIFVMGEIGNPGKAAVDPGTSLLQFLAQTGGFTKFAATKRIQLRRTDSQTGQPKVYMFNYRAVERGAAPANSIILQDGDIIVVPERRLFE